jgi:hypothetical protein
MRAIEIATCLTESLPTDRRCYRGDSEVAGVVDVVLGGVIWPVQTKKYVTAPNAIAMKTRTRTAVLRFGMQCSRALLTLPGVCVTNRGLDGAHSR